MVLDSKDKFLRKLDTAEMHRLENEQYKKMPKFPLEIICDNLRSMHNVGSVFRTADAFRVKKVHLCESSPKPPHRAIHKTALGATESVEWEYHEKTVDCVHSLKEQGYFLIALEQTTNSIPLQHFADLLPQQKIALIIGNEIIGVQDEVLALCDSGLEIPQYGTKHSLNVSVSTGIAIWGIFHAMGLTKGSFSEPFL